MDYKYEIQMIADDLAAGRYGKELSELKEDTQDIVWQDAEEEFNNRMAERAEMLRDAKNDP